MDLEEKEKLYMKILRRLNRNWLYADNKFLRRVFLKNNTEFWEGIGLMKKPRFLQQNLEMMRLEGLIKGAPNNNGYVLTEKGKKLLKRGWIYREKKWYDADFVRKYSVIISVTSLFISIVGTDNIRKFSVYIYEFLINILKQAMMNRVIIITFILNLRWSISLTQ